jgi:hypothetical protein
MLGLAFSQGTKHVEILTSLPVRKEFSFLDSQSQAESSFAYVRPGLSVRKENVVQERAASLADERSDRRLGAHSCDNTIHSLDRLARPLALRAELAGNLSCRMNGFLSQRLTTENRLAQLIERQYCSVV